MRQPFLLVYLHVSDVTHRRSSTEVQRMRIIILGFLPEYYIIECFALLRWWWWWRRFTLIAQECQWILLEFQSDEDGDEDDDDDLLRVAELIMQTVTHSLF